MIVGPAALWVISCGICVRAPGAACDSLEVELFPDIQSGGAVRGAYS